MGDEGMGSAGMKFGSLLGKGAAKAGKKVAQSEAGRRAGKAAVKGAADGVTEDFMSRYGGSSQPTSPTVVSSEPAKLSATTPTTPTVSAAPTDDKPGKFSSYQSWDNDDSNQHYQRPRRSNAPPKPSLFNRLNFMKDTSKKPVRRVVRRQVDPKERIYNSRLAKQPDWDRLENARALFNFKGEMKCDLEFRKGQVIQIITKTDTQEDWWEGKIEDRIGIFPANYVKIM